MVRADFGGEVRFCGVFGGGFLVSLTVRCREELDELVWAFELLITTDVP